MAGGYPDPRRHIIGVGPGPGIGLLFIIMGALTSLEMLAVFLDRQVRPVEQELRDSVSGEVGTKADDFVAETTAASTSAAGS